MIRIIVIIFLLGTGFIYPTFILFISLLNFFTVAIKNSFTILFWGNKYKIKPRRRPGGEKDKFVSILLATHNEPPLVVKNTLRSLAKQNYKNFEVLVLDNNTQNKFLWQPVKEYCELLGNNFKFFHVDGLEGFKAGALDWLMQKIDSRSEYVGVIDADYEVEPAFISSALSYFSQDDIAFVQLPQAYLNVNYQNSGLALEYEYFFASYMELAGKLECINATGTLGLFNISILKKVGSFKADSITEDAELGTRMALAGYRSVYVPRIMGRGLMPFSLSDLKKQRNRWAVGNAQVLKKYLWPLITNTKLNWKKKISLFSQLTAWSNFTFPASLIMVVFSILKIFNISNLEWKMAFDICLITILAYLLLKFCNFYLVFRTKYKVSLILRAFCIHIGMNYIYSINYFYGLLQIDFKFFRTNKFVFLSNEKQIWHVVPELVFSLVPLCLGIFLAYSKEFYYATGMFILAIIPILIFVALKETVATKEVSGKILNLMEKRLRHNI